MSDHRSTIRALRQQLARTQLALAKARKGCPACPKCRKCSSHVGRALGGALLAGAVGGGLFGYRKLRRLRARLRADTGAVSAAQLSASFLQFLTELAQRYPGSGELIVAQLRARLPEQDQERLRGFLTAPRPCLPPRSSPR